MQFLIYGAVVLLCLVTFRSWRAVLPPVLTGACRGLDGRAADGVTSPIKFQAEMGPLLAFMFLWSMLGRWCCCRHWLISCYGQPRFRSAMVPSGWHRRGMSCQGASSAELDTPHTDRPRLEPFMDGARCLLRATST